MKKLDLWIIRSRIRFGQAMDVLGNEKGIGTVAMIMILVVLIGLVLILKKS